MNGVYSVKINGINYGRIVVQIYFDLWYVKKGGAGSSGSFIPIAHGHLKGLVESGKIKMVKKFKA